MIRLEDILPGDRINCDGVWGTVVPVSELPLVGKTNEFGISHLLGGTKVYALWDDDGKILHTTIKYISEYECRSTVYDPAQQPYEDTDI